MKSGGGTPHPTPGETRAGPSIASQPIPPPPYQRRRAVPFPPFRHGSGIRHRVEPGRTRNRTELPVGRRFVVGIAVPGNNVLRIRLPPQRSAADLPQVPQEFVRDIVESGFVGIQLVDLPQQAKPS